MSQNLIQSMLNQGSIFISYRREDSKDFTENLYSCLVKEYGAASVFRDTNSMYGGDYWKEILKGQLSQCRILIAVIGPKWIDISKNGQRRLEDPEDWVRLEIEYALEQDIQVIPVLINNTHMPSRGALPGFWLKNLPERHAVAIADSPTLNPQHVKQLVQSIQTQLRKPKTKNFRDELNKDNTLEMVHIEGDSFWMGAHNEDAKRYECEIPYHKVKVQEFWIGRYPITRRQWYATSLLDRVDRELDPDPSPVFEEDFKESTLPVMNVNWHEAVEFCKRLSNHTNRLYRLPTEAEWEYACRANTYTPFYFGKTISINEANYRHGNTRTIEENKVIMPVIGKTTPVKSFDPNTFGLYDMHGNIFEWCQDHWHETYEGAPQDGSAWLEDDDDKYRIVRGGSWNSHPRHCRSSYRNALLTNCKQAIVGFRVACSI